LSGTARALLAAITLLALGLRLHGLTDQPLWFDEVNTICRADASSPIGVVTHDRWDVQAPLYDVFTWALVKVCGRGELAVRLPAAIVGAALVPATWLLTSEFFAGWIAAAIAALLVAVAPVLVAYGQEARPYALLALLTAVALHATARVVASGGERGVRRLALLGPLLLLTHYYGALVVASIAVHLALNHASWRERRRHVVLALAASVVVALAWAPIAVLQFRTRDYPSVYEPLDFRSALLALDAWSLEGAAAYAHDFGRCSFTLLIAAAFGVWLLLGRPKLRPRREFALLPLTLLLPLALAALLELAGKRTFTARNTILAAAPLAALVGGARGTVRPRWLAAAGVALLLFTSRRGYAAYADRPVHERPDFRSIARVLAEHADAPPLVHPDWVGRVVEYYAGMPWHSVAGGDSLEKTHAFARAHARLLFVAAYDHLSSPAPARAALAESHERRELFDFTGVQAELYAAR
jgi:hypothetical protein